MDMPKLQMEVNFKYQGIIGADNKISGALIIILEKLFLLYFTKDICCGILTEVLGEVLLIKDHKLCLYGVQTEIIQ